MSESTSKLFYDLKELFSNLQSDVDRLTQECKELRKRIDTIEGKPTSHPSSNVPLTVIFPNGDIIAEQQGIRTFIKTIERIGIERVKELKIIAVGKYSKYGEIFLISEHRNDFCPIAHQEKVGQYYVWKNHDTPDKEKWLNQISDRLNLGLKISGKIKRKHPLLR